VAAQRTVALRRAARISASHEDSPEETRFEIDSFRVPFCETCIRKHQDAQTPVDAWLICKRLIGGSGAGDVAGVAIFFIRDGIAHFSFIPIVFAALPGSVAAFLLHRNWRNNEYMSIPPAGSVASAVEFTPALGLDYEPHWRAFRFRDAAYASQFRALNADKLWDPLLARAMRKKRHSRTMWTVGTIVAVLLIWGLWNDYGPDVLDLIDRLR
jgi:hypothetical protein